MGKTLKGVFKSISVSEDSIFISNNIGHKSTEFPLSEVTNFIFQKGSFTKNGFLTICTFDGAGYNVALNTAATNKNSVMFQYTKNNEFELLYLKLRGMVTLKSFEELKPKTIETPEIKPINIEQNQPIPSQYVDESGHNIKICLNCGDILLAAARKCPTCGAKDSDLKIINSQDTNQITQVKENALHKNKKSFWQQVAEQGREINEAKAAQPKPLSKKERIKENKANAIVCCPKCGSTSITYVKKGFGVGKAAVGAFVAGPIGLVAGGIGANKGQRVCLNCKHKF